MANTGEKEKYLFVDLWLVLTPGSECVIGNKHAWRSTRSWIRFMFPKQRIKLQNKVSSYSYHDSAVFTTRHPTWVQFNCSSSTSEVVVPKQKLSPPHEEEGRPGSSESRPPSWDGPDEYTVRFTAQPRNWPNACCESCRPQTAIHPAAAAPAALYVVDLRSRDFNRLLPWTTFIRCCARLRSAGCFCSDFTPSNSTGGKSKFNEEQVENLKRQIMTRRFNTIAGFGSTRRKIWVDCTFPELLCQCQLETWTSCSNTSGADSWGGQEEICWKSAQHRAWLRYNNRMTVSDSSNTKLITFNVSLAGLWG